ncbi:MAG TPA: YceI family protein [Acidimicrobiia bacterium]|nr:YceI family protein [Acidimicrobiia bacterium]
MSRLAKILIAAVAGVVVVVGGGLFLGYKLFIESNPKPPAKITKTTTVGGGKLDGTYRVAPGDANSFVGYRVQEQLVGGAIDQTATGRTSDITGSFDISGTTVRDVSVTADLRTLTSDRSQRDNVIKDQGLESNRFPEAKFVLTSPIEEPKLPSAGETVRTTATGDFTLHGVTKHVQIPVEGRWDGRDVQVVGRLHIVFADYGIQSPRSPVVASIDNQGDMEFQIFFRKA